jgi:hypothetical protein
MKKTLLILASTIAISTTAQAETYLDKISKPYETLPALYKTCFDGRDAKPKARLALPHHAIFKANGKFGSYDDGDIWVGFNTHVFNLDTGKQIKVYEGNSAMCNAQGKAY